MERLETCDEFLTQSDDTELLPSDGQSVFRPQPNKMCHIQTPDLLFARIRSQNVYTEAEDVGTLAITSKRILYLGLGHDLTIQHNKILTPEPYADALRVTKSERKIPDRLLHTDGLLLHAILAVIEAARETDP